MNSSIVLTVVSDDHPGIVEALSQVLAEHGGNWAESNMMSLAGKFAGILLANLPAGRADAFMSDLAKLESDGLQIMAQRSGGSAAPQRMREFTLELVGQDHPGIVHDITQALARHKINVQELETRCESASMSGEKLFIANARLLIPDALPVDRIQDELESLANELMVDIKLED
jgi:glycine cleavage system regulatory protein